MHFALETVCFQILPRGVDCRAQLGVDNDNSRRSSRKVWWRDSWSVRIVQSTLNTVAVTDSDHLIHVLVLMVLYNIEEVLTHVLAVARSSWIDVDDIRFGVLVVYPVKKYFVIAFIALRVHDEVRHCRKNRLVVSLRSRLDRSDGRN